MTDVRTALGVFLSSLLLVAVSVNAVYAGTPKVKEGITVAPGKKVSIEYTLTLGDKQVVDTNVGKQPLTFVQGAKEIIPGLDKALIGMKTGESKHVTVKPEEGYGPVRKEAVVEAGKSQLPPDAWKVGSQVQTRTAAGQTLRGTVTKISGDKATIDFNHPLAGKTLFFDVKVLDIK